MDYFKIYWQLINSRVKMHIERQQVEEYYEKHHILPRCLSGTDDKENIVVLTAREHFLAHALLVKMYPTHKGVTNAFMMMKWNKSKKRYINARLYEQLKKYWRAAHSGANHHLYGKTHSAAAKGKISAAKKGKMIVRNKEDHLFTVDVNDPRVTSGELVHHSKGRKMSDVELQQHKLARTGFSNPNANPVTDAEILKQAVAFYRKTEVWCKKDWLAYCKEHRLPITYSKIRFNGKGYNELLRLIEEEVGSLKKISKKDYAGKISNTLREQKKKWYYNTEARQTKLLRQDEVTHNWKPGRKLKWD